MNSRKQVELREQVNLLEKLTGVSDIRLETQDFVHDTPAPNEVSLNITKKLLRILSKYDFLPEKVVPSGAGGITLFYYNNGSLPAMFEVQNNGKVWAAYLGGDKKYLQDISVDEFDPKVIEELKLRLY